MTQVSQQTTHTHEPSPAERVLQILHPQAVKEALVNDPPPMLAPLVPRLEGVDWSLRAWQQIFIDCFAARMQEAQPYYLAVSKAERPRLIADVLLQLLPVSGSLPAIHGILIPQIVGERPGLLPEIRAAVWPRCLEVAADTIRAHGNAGALGSMLTEQDRGSRSIRQAVKDHLLSILQEHSGDLSDDADRKQFQLAMIFHNSDSRPAALALVADPQVIEAGDRFLYTSLRNGTEAQDVREDAALLGRMELLASREFLAAVPPQIDRALTIAASAPPAEKREPSREALSEALSGDFVARAGEERSRIGYLENAVGQLTHFVLDDPGVPAGASGLFPPEIERIIEKLAPKAEYAIVAALRSTGIVGDPFRNRLNAVRSAVQIFARPNFRDSNVLAEHVERAAKDIELGGYLFPEQVQDLLLCAPQSHRSRIMQILRARAVPLVHWRLADLARDVADLPPNQRYGMIAEEVGFLARCVAVTTPRQASSAEMLRLFELTKNDLSQLRRQFISALEEAKGWLATRDETVALLAPVIAEGDIVTPYAQRMFKIIGDLEIDRRGEGSESVAAAIAVKLARYLKPSQPDGTAELVSPREELEIIARLLQDAGLADELRGIERRDLLIAGARVLRAAQALPVQNPVVEPVRNTAEPVQHERFQELCDSYSLFEHWGDREWASDILDQLRDIWISSLGGDEKYRDYLLLLERQHAAWGGDTAQLAEIQLAIVNGAWSRGLENLTRGERLEMRLDLVRAGELFLSLAKPGEDEKRPPGASKNLKQTVRLLRRALTVEAQLTRTALDDAVGPSDGEYDPVVADPGLPYKTRCLLALCRLEQNAATRAAKVLRAVLRRANRFQVLPGQGDQEEGSADAKSIVDTLERCAERFLDFGHGEEARRVLQSAARLQRQLVKFWRNAAVIELGSDRPVHAKYALALAELHTKIAFLCQGTDAQESGLKNIAYARKLLVRHRLQDANAQLTAAVEELYEVLQRKLNGGLPPELN